LLFQTESHGVNVHAHSFQQLTREIDIYEDQFFKQFSNDYRKNATATKFMETEKGSTIDSKQLKKLGQTPTEELTVCQILALFRRKHNDNLGEETRGRGKVLYPKTLFLWPFGTKNRPANSAVGRSIFLSMPNLVIASYLWQIEKHGAVFEEDSRMMQGEGPCLQIKKSSECICNFGTDKQSRCIKLSMTQTSGVVHSILHGYFHTLPCQPSDFQSNSGRTGCHLCLEPNCIIHVMIAHQRVNLTNEKCLGHSFCKCWDVEGNYNNQKCLYCYRDIQTKNLLSFQDIKKQN
jgi:hypothetical protein